MLMRPAIAWYPGQQRMRRGSGTVEEEDYISHLNKMVNSMGV